MGVESLLNKMYNRPAVCTQFKTGLYKQSTLNISMITVKNQLKQCDHFQIIMSLIGHNIAFG